jgi:hypothetical protein
MEVKPALERAAFWLAEAENIGLDVNYDPDGYLAVIRDLARDMRAYRVLRLAVDAMMAPLGYYGTISARDDRVQAVMDALAQVDAEDRA